MRLFRTIAVRALAALLLAAPTIPLTACGKKGPLYLPTPPAADNPTATPPTERDKQERR